mmetsp:Transcript_5695/g.15460  ORF Transcript_5695/g.15460 Transcript_5695/m.15460 type:complete len:207 (+) Transcript_5695:125-745(+)
MVSRSLWPLHNSRWSSHCSSRSHRQSHWQRAKSTAGCSEDRRRNLPSHKRSRPNAEASSVHSCARTRRRIRASSSSNNASLPNQTPGGNLSILHKPSSAPSPPRTLTRRRWNLLGVGATTDDHQAGDLGRIRWKDSVPRRSAEFCECTGTTRARETDAELGVCRVRHVADTAKMRTLLPCAVVHARLWVNQAEGHVSFFKNAMLHS